MARKRNTKTIIEGLRLERYAAEGKSVGRMEDGKTIFVSEAVPGDLAKVLVRKNKASYAEGTALEILEPSEDRVIPFCKHFGTCGGCKWQMLPYEKQLEYKQVQVFDQLTRLSGVVLPDIHPILGNDRDRRYRNKVEFTFSELEYLTREQLDQAGGAVIEHKPVLGFHAPGFFDKVVDIDECHLIEEPVNAIKNLLRSYTLSKGYEYYNQREQSGWLRNMVIRKSSVGEVMVNLVVKDSREELFEILELLKNEFPEITSLHYTINPKVNDTLYDLEVITYYGKGYIEEKLEDFTFKISPKSFFQTNTRQAEHLYRIARDFAGLTGRETIYDLYCGAGSIGIFLSGQAKRIIGIEAVPDAIEDARINAALNGLQNATFIAGDVIKIIDDDFYARYGKPDVVITDPPRAGMHEKMIQQLLQMKAPRIVYVSCNPATQARDLQLLDELYKVVRIQPVDMFPQTHHIETVVLLQLKTRIAESGEEEFSDK